MMVWGEFVPRAPDTFCALSPPKRERTKSSHDWYCGTAAAAGEVDRRSYLLGHAAGLVEDATRRGRLGRTHGQSGGRPRGGGVGDLLRVVQVCEGSVSGQADLWAALQGFDHFQRELAGVLHVDREGAREYRLSMTYDSGRIASWKHDTVVRQARHVGLLRRRRGGSARAPGNS